MQHKLIYYLGKHSYIVRKLIFKLTGEWYWGMITFIKDNPKWNIITMDELALKHGADWINKQLENIFYNKKE